MKTVAILLLAVSLSGCQNTSKNSIVMNDYQAIQEIVTQLFVYSDQRNWDGVEAQFAENVNLDYSTMTGNPATEVTPSEITSGWKTVLPGFTHTHHQIGNFLAEVNGTTANAFCYGTATHYLEDESGSVWTVVGSYDFELSKVGNAWKITSMVFNYKYQEGNAQLVQKAIENSK